MADGDSKNFDGSVSFLVNPMRTEMLDDSFRNVKFVSDDAESLTRLRIDNFNLRLLCHKYEEVFNKGQVKNMGLRMYEAEQNIENLRNKLASASEMISSLKRENEGLKSDNEEWNQRFESSDVEWRRRYDSLFFEFQELKSLQTKAENRCETVKCESLRLENVKNAEIATLQQKLTSTESHVALLEAELSELRIRGNASSLQDDNKENSSLLNFSALLDPLSSPVKNNKLSLLRRYNAAQDMLKTLKSNCDSLSADLSTCRQELSVTENKFRLVLEQYEVGKAAHLRDLERRDDLERNLHDRITDLVNEYHQATELNDELSGKVKQLKESEARLKEAHMVEVKKLNRLLVDRERALLELYTSDTQVETNILHIDETEQTAEVTQYRHEADSSIFNSTINASRKEGTTQLPEAISVEVTKLQHEVALLRSKLVAQVKANTRLKAAFNALSESNPPTSKTVVANTTNNNPPANLSTSINPSILEEAGNTSQVNESLISLLNSNKKVSQTLDKTVNELKSALSKMETELSVSLLEVSQVGEESKHVGDGMGAQDAILASTIKPDRLRDVYSLIKGLVNQFDNLRTFRSSFHETVNRSVLTSSLCLDTSSRYAVSGADLQTSRQTSFAESTGGANGDSRVPETFGRYKTDPLSTKEPEHSELAEKSAECEELMGHLSHNNTTFHLLREHLNDNTMEDLSLSNSVSFTASQRSHVLDITGLETHSRNIFDRVTHAVAGIQEALDAWSLDAAKELLAAINVNTDGTHQPPVSSHDVARDASANLDTLLNLVTRFVGVLSKTRSVEVATESAAAFSDWCDLVHKWFQLFIDTLQGRRGASNLTELTSQLSALELQFNEEFAVTAVVTQYPVTLSRQNVSLHVSDVTEPPTISLYENGEGVSSRCEQLASAIEKLKADLSLNVRELTDKEAAVVDLEAQLTEAFSITRTKESKIEQLEGEVANMDSKVQDLERQLNEAYSAVRAKEVQIEVLEAEIPQMKTELRQLELRCSEATSKAQAKEKRVEELETEVEESKNRVHRMDAQLAETLLSVRVKEAIVEEMEVVVKDKELMVASLEEQLAETETKLAQKETRVSELKVAANDLRSMYDDLERQFSKASRDAEDWKAKSERLEDLLAQSTERESGFSQQLRQALDEVTSLMEQKSALETQLKEKMEEHRAKTQSIHMKYDSLLEVAKSRCVEMAEECQRLQAERDNLCEDLETSKEEKLMLQTDLTMARMVSAEAQINLGAYLEEAPLGDNKEDLEELRLKARKYPELKNLAFSLKSKLDRRAVQLHDSTKENTRLKMIVSDHEKRVKDLADELERLQEQILVKNEVIKKLENLVRLSTNDHPIFTMSEKPDEISPTENARGANLKSSNLFNHDATVDAVDVGILSNHPLPERLSGVNSLMADIDATVREISGCLDAVTAEVSGGGGCGDQRHDNDTSTSLADPMLSLSTDTPSSLVVSFGGPLPSTAQNVNTNSPLPDRLNHLVNKLSTFWSAMTQELRMLIRTVQSSAANRGGDCGCEDHSRARKLVRRSVDVLGYLNVRYPTNRSFSHVLESLNEALELLHRQSAAAVAAASSSSLGLSRGQEQLETVGTAPVTTTTTSATVAAAVTGTTSSCSCSCRQRCNRMASSIQELTNMLNTTANTLNRGGRGRGDTERVSVQSRYYAHFQDSREHSLSN